MKHEITIHENTGATKTLAPYLGSYVTRETVKMAAYADTLAAKCGLPSIQVQAIIDGVFAQIETLEADTLVRIHLDGFTVVGVIKGTFDSADAAFDATANKLQLTLRLEDEVKNELADVTGTIVTDDTTTKVRVDNVVDVDSPRPYNVLYGQGKARVQGINLVTTDADAKVFLMDKNGATYPCVVDEIVSKQLIIVHTEALLPAGDYKLCVSSRGGDAEGPLQTSYRKVKYLHVEQQAPTIVKGYTASDPSREGIYILYGDFVLEGTNLLNPTSIKLKYLSDAGQQDVALDLTKCTVKSTKVTIPSDAISSYIEESSSTQKPVLTVTTAGGSASYEFDSAGS